jgi:hypothetical protein
MTWDEAVAHALALPGATLSTSYGQPAVKVNGRAILNTGREPATSFVLHLDHDRVAMLRATHPETFWTTPHYEGFPAVLVRYDTPNDALVREMIERAAALARSKAPPRPRR